MGGKSRQHNRKELDKMTAAATQTRLMLPVVAALLLFATAAPRAHAGDLGKILGALAVGYVTYEVLDSLDDIRDNTRGQYYNPPPPVCRPAPPPVHRNYNPPSPYYYGGENRYWYNEGYKDGFKDGEQYGYREGHQDGYRQGDRDGYRRGIRTGYRYGYGDGYDDGHHDGFIEGVHVPRGRR
jgi:hypothetical protein